MKITDKTHVLRTYDGIEIWITRERAQALSEHLNERMVIEIDENYISTKNISGVYAVKDFRKSELKKAGEYFDKEATERDRLKAKGTR